MNILINEAYCLQQMKWLTYTATPAVGSPFLSEPSYLKLGVMHYCADMKEDRVSLPVLAMYSAY